MVSGNLPEIPSDKYFEISITMDEVNRNKKLENLQNLIKCRLVDAHINSLERAGIKWQ